jgi:class 3 adenylate cyclase
MECAHCNHENADGARFCGECGASLTRDVTCPGCGHLNPPGQKFCNGCSQGLGASAPAATRDPRAYTPKHLAEKILGSRTALEGERKQVTVLFADVKGSMELAEQLDPEEWHGIMDRFFQLLADGVHRFEGTVNQYTGDGIMALFGAPIAHEDHAQRGCWAALHLTEALRRYGDELRLARGLDFSVRIGLNSGEVVVGRIGDDLRMDYTAQGHTVGLARRMEQLASLARGLHDWLLAAFVRLFHLLQRDSHMDRSLGDDELGRIAVNAYLIWFSWLGYLRTVYPEAPLDRTASARGALQSFLVLAPHLEPTFRARARAVLEEGAGMIAARSATRRTGSPGRA